jgi:PAS domain-containing protein
VPQWNKDFEELTGYKPTDLILGIEPLYMMIHDPRFDVLSKFLLGEMAKSWNLYNNYKVDPHYISFNDCKLPMQGIHVTGLSLTLRLNFEPIASIDVCSVELRSA